MKTLLPLLFLLLCTGMTLKAGDGKGKVKILASSHFDLTCTESFAADFILSSTFNQEDENIDLIFTENIKMIQIFDLNGELISIIPIDSDELRMGMSLFDKGNFKLGFQIEGEPEVKFADISIR